MRSVALLTYSCEQMDSGRELFLESHVTAGAQRVSTYLGESKHACWYSLRSRFILSTNQTLITQGASSVETYFPTGVWYDAWTYERVRGGQKVMLNVPLGEVAAHFRGGTIIPRQRSALTAAAVRASAFTLILALPDMVRLAFCLTVQPVHNMEVVLA